MKFTKYGKIIDITLTVAGIVVPLITKMRSDKKAEEELTKKVIEEVTKRMASQNA